MSLSHRLHRIAGPWDGKLVGDGCRLTWSLQGWKLEELQAKGKKQLRVSQLQIPPSSWGNMGAYIAENVLHSGNVSGQDSYDKMKSKIESAYKDAAEKTIAANKGAKLDFLKDYKWSEEKVHYLKVVPEGTDPFVAKGKDFDITVSWTTFKLTDSHNEDAHDPSYTMYEASSAAAGRKLYQLLKAQPDALKTVAKNSFTDWLTKNKIGYKTHFSQWH